MGERRAATRRRAPKPEAGRQTEEQLRAQMEEDQRRAKEQERAAKAARKEEKRLRREAERAQAAAAGSGSVPAAEARRHGPSELPYPAAAGDVGMASDDEEGGKKQLSWLLGQLLQ